MEFSATARLLRLIGPEALSNAANAAVAKKVTVPRDALLLEVRRVPSAGMYLDTIRQTRLALLPK